MGQKMAVRNQRQERVLVVRAVCSLRDHQVCWCVKTAVIVSRFHWPVVVIINSQSYHITPLFNRNDKYDGVSA